jgi:hypothetical protein
MSDISGRMVSLHKPSQCSDRSARFQWSPACTGARIPPPASVDGTLGNRHDARVREFKVPRVDAFYYFFFPHRGFRDDLVCLIQASNHAMYCRRIPPDSAPQLVGGYSGDKLGAKAHYNSTMVHFFSESFNTATVVLPVVRPDPSPGFRTRASPILVIPAT